MLSLKIKNKTDVHFMTFIQHCTGDSTQCNQEGKTKNIWIGMEEVRLCLLAGNMINHIENPNESTKS